MMIKKLPLQDLILAVLAFDQKQGAEIAEMIEHTHFDSFLCEFARCLLEYRRRYGRPPSEQVLRDLAERSSCGEHEQAEAIMDRLKTLRNPDAKYVAERIDDFINSQQLRGALWEANERYEQGGELGRLVSDIRTILAPAINTPPRTKEDSIMSVAEFLRLPLHDPEMLLPPWLEAESTTMLHGPAGSRKTLALMELALGLASAQPCFAGRCGEWTAEVTKMARGGKRPGAGRPPGSRSKKTLARMALAEEAAKGGITPGINAQAHERASRARGR